MSGQPFFFRNSLKIVVGTFILSSGSFMLQAFAADPDPLEIMKVSDARHRIATERVDSKMFLQKKGEEPSVRGFYTITAQEKQGDKSLFVFTNPANIKDTTMLYLENVAGGEDDQWLYLPAFRKTRRVGAGELGDRFVGTDLFNEDLRRRRVENYSYKLLGSEKVEGQDCWKIEQIPSAPKTVKESPYGKNILWVRKDIYFTVRAQLFDRRMKPLKQARWQDLKNVSGEVWRANKITVKDIQRKHRTVLITESRTVNFKVPPDTFNQHKLGS